MALLAGVNACGDGQPKPAPAPPDSRFVERLQSPQDFAALQGEGWSVKYLGAVDGRQALAPLDRRCVFQDTRMFSLHLQFLRSFPQLAQLDFESYLALVMKNSSRVWWAGELQLVPGGKHPVTGRSGVLAAFVYADPDDPVALDDLVTVYQRLKECAPYARDLLVLVGADPAQARDFAGKADALAARGVPVVDLATLRPVVGAEGYSLGEGYGYLRVVPRGVRPRDWGPRDILITEGSYDDLGLVAGLITSLPQNLHSHVNLRLREKMIPSARISDIYDNQAVLLLEGKLAHLTVKESEARLESAKLEDAEAFWASRRPPVRPLMGDLGEQRLQDFSQLRASGALAYGVKASNLGELHQVLPAENRAEGFGIPFSIYRDFRDGTEVGPRITAFLADPRTTTDAAFRRSGLAELQKAILAAPLPAGLLDRLRQAARQAFGEGYATQPLKFRSSSNAEDGETSTGAGLYDSARGCFADDDDGDESGPSACLSAAEHARLDGELNRRLVEWSAFPERNWLSEVVNDLKGDLTKERSVARALRKVFASLWNERAFEERAYFGMNHADVLMGVAVNGSFVLERVDAVVLTNLPVTEGAPLLRVVSQRDGNPVVRPADPLLVAEVMTFRRGDVDQPTDVKIVTPSSLSPQPLWGEAHLGRLSQLLGLIQDHFAHNVYPQIPDLSLDLEVKITEDNRVVIKQVRPYHATGLTDR